MGDVGAYGPAEAAAANAEIRASAPEPTADGAAAAAVGASNNAARNGGRGEGNGGGGTPYRTPRQVSDPTRLSPSPAEDQARREAPHA